MTARTTAAGLRRQRDALQTAARILEDMDSDLAQRVGAVVDRLHADAAALESTRT